MTRSQRKSIRFPENEEDLVTVHSITTDALTAPALWFQKDDYYEFKACARRVAKEWRKRGASPMLDGTYEEPTSNIQEVLTTWARQQPGTPSRRGLENLISKNLSKERACLRTKVISSILSAQKTMQGYGFEVAMQARELALISEVYSERSRQFALQMGFADAIVLAEANRQEAAAALQQQQQLDEEMSFAASERSSESETSTESAASSTLSHPPSAPLVYNSPSRPKASERKHIALDRDAANPTSSLLLRTTKSNNG